MIFNLPIVILSHITPKSHTEEVVAETRYAVLKQMRNIDSLGSGGAIVIFPQADPRHSIVYPL